MSTESQEMALLSLLRFDEFSLGSVEVIFGLGHSLYPIAMRERTLHSLTSMRKYMGITVLSGSIVV
jgi:hypothetical protein